MFVLGLRLLLAVYVWMLCGVLALVIYRSFGRGLNESPQRGDVLFSLIAGPVALLLLAFGWCKGFFGGATDAD